MGCRWRLTDAQRLTGNSQLAAVFQQLLRNPWVFTNTQRVASGSRNKTKRFDAERLGIFLATIATDHALIEAVAAEVSEGIETAVSFWMTQIEAALLNPRLTTLGRMHAVREIVQRYHTGDPSEASDDRYSA
jgi:hypothetical protein